MSRFRGLPQKWILLFFYLALVLLLVAVYTHLLDLPPIDDPSRLFNSK
ncbi:MAG TPA: hypothetical protein VGL91_23370 [Acidobacteriota bacterium]|jgi:hypothetical protein